MRVKFQIQMQIVVLAVTGIFPWITARAQEAWDLLQEPIGSKICTHQTDGRRQERLTSPRAPKLVSGERQADHVSGLDAEQRSQNTYKGWQASSEGTAGSPPEGAEFRQLYRPPASADRSSSIPGNS